MASVPYLTHEVDGQTTVIEADRYHALGHDAATTLSLLTLLIVPLWAFAEAEIRGPAASEPFTESPTPHRQFSSWAAVLSAMVPPRYRS